MDIFKEALLEGLRLVVLSIIPIIIAGIDPVHGNFSINWMIVGAVALLTLLRFIDKFLHELGKETKSGGWLHERGLTGF